MNPTPTRIFGYMPDGRVVHEYVLTNKNGLELRVINYGAIITAVKTPDRHGALKDIVLGYDSFENYLTDNFYLGAVIGRYGNRIATGKFSLGGTDYTLTQNNNGQHLHGGAAGFHKVFWNTEAADSNKVRLTYTSREGEDGYPGNLNVEVYYELTDANELMIAYTATTDKRTIVNLTQHAYFNLCGNAGRDILNHQVEIYANEFLPVTRSLIPTGELKPVAGTPFDFSRLTSIGMRINENDEQLVFAGGYDHCWVLSDKKLLKHAARVVEPDSGRAVNVYTTEPGMQFYSGNFLNDSIIGKNGAVYKQRYGFCLETQHFPDSPNQKHFPSTELMPGETYRSQTIYALSTL